MNNTEIRKVFETIKNTNSSKMKLQILKDNSCGEIREICDRVYNRIKYTYGVTTWNFKSFSKDLKSFRYPSMFRLLNDLVNRALSGDKALAACKEFYDHTDEDTKWIFEKILDHDLGIGISETTIGKVYPGLIDRPHYNRCDVFSSDKVEKNIKFPAFLQLKCDGTYRECHVCDGDVTFRTRSGEIYKNPKLERIMSLKPNGYYTGEFTLGPADKPDANRSVSNGNINSDNPDFDKINFTIWDYLSENEYNEEVETDYTNRLAKLNDIFEGSNNPLIHVVPTYIVYSLKEVSEITSKIMNRGLEGTVLKAMDMKFKNGTSKQQLKIKLKVDADLRCVGFKLGTPGTKYENQNKVILFESDDKKIKGQCSGMTDAMIKKVTAKPENYIGKIVTIQFNDISLAKDSDTYALSHPRFSELRDDKTESDTLERVIELRDMSKRL